MDRNSKNVYHAELKLAPAGSLLTSKKQANRYDGGFHIAPAANKSKSGNRIIGKRTALQTFTC